MAGHYNIPRDTKGEGRILMIFSTKAFIATGVGAFLGFCTIYPICAILNLKIVGWIAMALLGFIGFAITSFKIPHSENLEFFRKNSGDIMYDVIKKWLKFKKKKNKVYVYFTEEKKNG